MLTGHLVANSFDPDWHQIQTAYTESSELALDTQTTHDRKLVGL